MFATKDTRLISPEDYLKGEPLSEIKHELIDGHVYAMVGASANHERISVNVLRKFGNHLEAVWKLLSPYHVWPGIRA
jgi:Uma2 family endonuclease